MHRPFFRALPRYSASGFLLALLFFTGVASAQSITDLQAKAVTLGLAAQPSWIALGHYEQQPETAESENSSYVDDAQFFLAPNGATQPAAELQATLANLSFDASGSDAERDAHPRCRYPARYAWLAEQLAFSLDDYGVADCPLYASWREQIQAERVTLVYAASYLNSPSSMYGHTLLRLDPADTEHHSDWLSWAVNFGADTPAEDGSIVYAYKGIFGGYPGKFNVLAYLEKVADYNKIENRDLWEYELNLSGAETERLVTHLWELKDIRFDYYFFDENCSYRLLELLEFARPGTELTDHFSLFAIPADTVRAVKDAGFIAEVKRRPSKTNLLKHQLQQLDRDELKLTKQLLVEPAAAMESQLWATQTAQSQARMLKTASDFLNYKYRKTQRSEAEVQKRFTLLRASSQRPTPKFTDLLQPIAPEDGHESSSIALGGGRHAGQYFVDLDFRFSFHDLTDNLPGYDQGAAINMGRIKLRHREDHSVQLRELGLIQIHSFSPRNRFFKPISWETSVTAEYLENSNGGELAAQVNGNAGLSYALWSDNISYALLGARLEYNDDIFSEAVDLAGQSTAGSLLYSRLGTTHLRWQRQFFTSGYDRQRVKLEHNLPLAKDWSLLGQYHSEKYSGGNHYEAGLQLRYFF